MELIYFVKLDKWKENTYKELFNSVAGMVSKFDG